MALGTFTQPNYGMQPDSPFSVIPALCVRKRTTESMAKKSFEASAASVPNQEAVAQLAHEIWESEGRPEGRAVEHWYRAVSQLKAQTDGEIRMSGTTTTPKRPRSRAASEKQFQAASQ